MENTAFGSLTLPQMVVSLQKVSDECWGLYLLSRDMLCDRIPPDRKPEMIKKSISCGDEYARRTLMETGRHTADNIQKFYRIKVNFINKSQTNKQMVFANFTSPNEITIMKQPLEKYEKFLSSLSNSDAATLPTVTEVRDLLFGHELYHYMEERYQDEIYTRTEKIRLWKLLCFKNESPIRALGEIAAMAFARTLTQISYFPALLDVLLPFCYNTNYAFRIYKDIMAIRLNQKDN